MHGGMPGSRLMPLVTLSLLAFITILMCFTEPETNLWIPGCPFHELTGLYCPGCGSLRALDFLVEGRPGEALRSNAMLIPSLALVLTGLASEIAHPGRGLFRAGSTASRITGTAFLVTAVVFTVLRNLPLEPCRWLVPS